ncbi:MAG: hypothetical protein VW268_10940 [Rhodospirillaceae bacterium]
MLDGGRKALTEGRLKFVVCELNGFGLGQMGFSQAVLREKMAGFGYPCFLINDDGSLPRLVPDGVDIVGQFIPNVLFAKMDAIVATWPTVNTD